MKAAVAFGLAQTTVVGILAMIYSDIGALAGLCVADALVTAVLMVKAMHDDYLGMAS